MKRALIGIVAVIAAGCASEPTPTVVVLWQRGGIAPYVIGGELVPEEIVWRPICTGVVVQDRSDNLESAAILTAGHCVPNEAIADDLCVSVGPTGCEDGLRGDGLAVASTQRSKNPDLGLVRLARSIDVAGARVRGVAAPAGGRALTATREGALARIGETYAGDEFVACSGDSGAPLVDGGDVVGVLTATLFPLVDGALVQKRCGTAEAMLIADGAAIAAWLDEVAPELARFADGREEPSHVDGWADRTPRVQYDAPRATWSFRAPLDTCAADCGMGFACVETHAGASVCLADDPAHYATVGADCWESLTDGVVRQACRIGSGYVEYQLGSFGAHPASYEVPDNSSALCNDVSASAIANYTPCKARNDLQSGFLNAMCQKTIQCAQSLYCENVDGIGFCSQIWADE